jgi:hypothetical protein
MIELLTNNSKSRSMIISSDRFANFNKARGISTRSGARVAHSLLLASRHSVAGHRRFQDSCAVRCPPRRASSSRTRTQTAEAIERRVLPHLPLPLRPRGTGTGDGSCGLSTGSPLVSLLEPAYEPALLAAEKAREKQSAALSAAGKHSSLTQRV